MSSTGQEVYPIGQWIGMVADERPDDPALIFAPQAGEDKIYSWRELDRWSNQLARLLEAQGVGEGDRVVAGIPNSPELYALWLATWKLGAQIATLRAAMPPHEYNALLEIAQPAAIVADWDQIDCDAPALTFEDLDQAKTLPDDALPIKLAERCAAVGTGGSSGLPKLIEAVAPAVGGPGRTLKPYRKPLLERFGGSLRQLICGPLYHGGPGGFVICAYVEGTATILMERFDASRALDVIEQHQPHFALFVPTMMQRMLHVPDIADRDLSSIELLEHHGASCPAWVKRGWIDLIGAERIFEFYGSTENIGSTTIMGDEWLDHPGSVGKPFQCDLKILDDEGNELPAGEVGLIYTRPLEARPLSARYVGAEQLTTTDDGFKTVGDLGWLDEEGYLYIADRRTDMIVTGGANVYPAEIEAILSQNPGVADVVVIGVPDKEWGRRVHAIVQPLDPSKPPLESDLDALCHKHLASYKAPKTYEYLPELPRNAAGKIRRSALVEERATQTAEGAVSR